MILNKFYAFVKYIHKFSIDIRSSNAKSITTLQQISKGLLGLKESTKNLMSQSRSGANNFVGPNSS